jgi:hypothetical protein
MAGVALPVWMVLNSCSVCSKDFFILACMSLMMGWDMVVVG